MVASTSSKRPEPLEAAAEVALLDARDQNDEIGTQGRHRLQAGVVEPAHPGQVRELGLLARRVVVDAHQQAPRAERDQDGGERGVDGDHALRGRLAVCGYGGQESGRDRQQGRAPSARHRGRIQAVGPPLRSEGRRRAGGRPAGPGLTGHPSRAGCPARIEQARWRRAQPAARPSRKEPWSCRTSARTVAVARERPGRCP
jgi:hypothetical protein